MIFVDDYNAENIKLAELIKSYGLEKQTWFAIDLNHFNAQDQIEHIHRMGFNIASHTVTHAHLSRIPIEDAIWEMKESKKIIDKITGKSTKWLVLPRGRTNEEVNSRALELGYKYIRGTGIFDIKNNKIGFNQTTIHAGCPIRPEYSEKKWTEFFDEYLYKVIKNGGNMKVWFHLAELDKYNEWENIKIMLNKLKEFYEIKELIKRSKKS